MEDSVIARKIRKDGGKIRLFVAVGKGVSQKAVERNKVKRRIRVVATGFLKKHPEVSVLVSAKKGATKKSFQQLEVETTRALQKVV